MNYIVRFPMKEPNSKAPPVARRDRWGTLKTLSSAKAGPSATQLGFGELLLVPSGTEDRSPPRERWGMEYVNTQPRRGGTVAHSFSRNHIHFIFSTKDRRNTIAKEWQPRLWAYLARICKNHEMIALAVGGQRTMYTSCCTCRRSFRWQRLSFC